LCSLFISSLNVGFHLSLHESKLLSSLGWRVVIILRFNLNHGQFDWLHVFVIEKASWKVLTVIIEEVTGVLVNRFQLECLAISDGEQSSDCNLLTSTPVTSSMITVRTFQLAFSITKT
jgi:hypothetical protein